MEVNKPTLIFEELNHVLLELLRSKGGVAGELLRESQIGWLRESRNFNYGFSDACALSKTTVATALLEEVAYVP